MLTCGFEELSLSLLEILGNVKVVDKTPSLFLRHLCYNNM